MKNKNMLKVKHICPSFVDDMSVTQYLTFFDITAFHQ